MFWKEVLVQECCAEPNGLMHWKHGVMENETHVADSPGRGHFNGITLSAVPYTMCLHLHAAFSTKSSRVASDSCMVALSRTCPKTFNHPGNTCNQSINAQQDRNQALHPFLSPWALEDNLTRQGLAWAQRCTIGAWYCHHPSASMHGCAAYNFGRPQVNGTIAA